MIQRKKLAQIPSRETTNSNGKWFRGLEVNWNRKYKSIVLFRILASKLIFSREKFSEEDQILLFNAYEECLVDLSEGREFKILYQTDLKICSMIIKNLPALLGNKNKFLEVRRYLRKIYQESNFLGGLVYLSEKENLETGKLCSMRSGEPKKPREPNRIGRGYRDKGNARNSAMDGTPSWQEVAQVFARKDPNCSRGQTQRLENTYRLMRNFLKNEWENWKVPSGFRSNLVKQMVR